MTYLSEHLSTVISDIANNGSISKDHFFVNDLTFEDKYELIRMESRGWLKIENGTIAALDGFSEAIEFYCRAAI